MPRQSESSTHTASSVQLDAHPNPGIHLSIPFRPRSVQTQAVCRPEYVWWMVNMKNQEPCLVAAYLMAPCANGSGNVAALVNATDTYPVPDVGSANGCTCSWSMYNLMQACAFCQTGDTGSLIDWSAYNAACTKDMLSAPEPFPKDIAIPLMTGIPGSYALNDPTTWTGGKFDPAAAEYMFNFSYHIDLTQFDRVLDNTTPEPYTTGRILTIVFTFVGGLALFVGLGWLLWNCPCSVGQRRRERWYKERVKDGEQTGDGNGNEDGEAEELLSEEYAEYQHRSLKEWWTDTKTQLVMVWEGRGAYYAAAERRREEEKEMRKLKRGLLQEGVGADMHDEGQGDEVSGRRDVREEEGGTPRTPTRRTTATMGSQARSGSLPSQPLVVAGSSGVRAESQTAASSSYITGFASSRGFRAFEEPPIELSTLPVREYRERTPDEISARRLESPGLAARVHGNRGKSGDSDETRTSPNTEYRKRDTDVDRQATMPAKSLVIDNPQRYTRTTDPFLEYQERSPVSPSGMPMGPEERYRDDRDMTIREDFHSPGMMANSTINNSPVHDDNVHGLVTSPIELTPRLDEDPWSAEDNLEDGTHRSASMPIPLPSDITTQEAGRTSSLRTAKSV